MAEVWLKRGDEVVEKAKFLVRGHSAVEMSADDPRGRPARKLPPATKG